MSQCKKFQTYPGSKLCAAVIDYLQNYVLNEIIIVHLKAHANGHGQWVFFTKKINYLAVSEKEFLLNQCNSFIINILPTNTNRKEEQTDIADGQQTQSIFDEII